MSKDEFPAAPSPADIKSAAESLKRIDALDHDAEQLIGVLRHEGGFEKRGGMIRNAIAPAYLGWIGNVDLARAVLEAILAEMTKRRARLVNEIGVPVSIQHKVWRLNPSVKDSDDA